MAATLEVLVGPLTRVVGLLVDSVRTALTWEQFGMRVEERVWV